MLIRAQVTLPGSISEGVGAGGPEVGATPDKHAVSENEYATVAAPNAVEHVDVNRVKPILHRQRRPFLRLGRYSLQ
jgi:hypothetical protein